jgi:hypothetical protein
MNEQLRQRAYRAYLAAHASFTIEVDDDTPDDVVTVLLAATALGKHRSALRRSPQPFDDVMVELRRMVPEATFTP